MEVRVNVNNKIYMLNEKMEFTTHPYKFQFIPITPDKLNSIEPNVFSHMASVKAIKIYKANEKEEKQEEEEKKDSPGNDDSKREAKTVDVAKTGDTPGTEKPEIEETTTGDGSKSGVSQQWTITHIYTTPSSLARINVGTDCLRVDLDSLSMIRGECPKVESLNNSEFYFEISLKEGKDLSSLPKLESENKKHNNDSGEGKKQVRKTEQSREVEETSKEQQHSRKKRKIIKKSKNIKSEAEAEYVDEQESEKAELEEVSVVEEESNPTSKEENKRIEESTTSTEVDTKVKDKKAPISDNKRLFIQVMGEKGDVKEVPVAFQKVKTNDGSTAISPVVDEKGYKKTLSTQSRSSTNKQKTHNSNVSHTKERLSRRKKKKHGLSNEDLIRMSGKYKSGETLPSHGKVSPDDMETINKLTEALKDTVNRVVTSEKSEESLPSDLLPNRLKKNDISTNNKNLNNDTFHKSLKRDSVSLLSSLKDNVSALMQVMT